MSDHTRADEGEGREPGEALFNHALDAAYYEARDLADKAGVSWLNAKRIADAYYAPVVHHDDLTINSLKHSLSSAEDRATQAEAEVARLTAALTEAERERDEGKAMLLSIAAVVEPPLEDGIWSGTVLKAVEAAEASASVLRERVATLEAEMDRLRKDNERLRWRHPAVLPDWNDLPDCLRTKLARAADGYDPDWGGDLAVNMYATLRQAMMEAPHADN
jgi:hypothetical protein